MKKPLPLVWLPADHRLLGSEGRTMPFLVLGDKYARAVKESAQAQPVVFALAGAEHIDDLLDGVDGVMLTGSPSNVHPSHFGAGVENTALPLDPQRDALTLNLVRACLERRCAVVGYLPGVSGDQCCAGWLAVPAGSKRWRVCRTTGRWRVRATNSSTRPVTPLRSRQDHAWRSGPAAQTAQVNSLHGQGVNRLAPGLRAVAHASDGLVEAFEVQGAATFAVAVQWHPEWRTAENPFYSALFAAFGDACRARGDARAQRAQNPRLACAPARSSL